jgi:hypothetical protein
VCQRQRDAELPSCCVAPLISDGRPEDAVCASEADAPQGSRSGPPGRSTAARLVTLSTMMLVIVRDAKFAVEETSPFH